MERFLAYPLEQFPYVVVALLAGFAVHEFAHAWTAYRFGDPTAKKEGRVTLNPLAHLDPLGTIAVFLMGFGWAKPVPVNRFYFRHPRLAGVWVTVAGPFSNLALAFLFTLLFRAWFQFGGSTAVPGMETGLYILVYLNVILFLFNLFPVPPLDGYRILEDLAPARLRPRLRQYEPYGILVFVVLLVTPLGDAVFGPLFGMAETIIAQMASIAGLAVVH
ncbi:Zn-dependent protease [Melghirimyces profundicolus]|uniref:Zn-dependent protease n=1 Tax=Melghirimyces profundicolus TaxID=1242148 RepID=A0A2T6BXN4_9BACL|nr:site-2 protease family protein [Melghirimyces profundicolus]PTX60825.1 Zn-dependent protease [Melghirimyces profundicolus]